MNRPALAGAALLLAAAATPVAIIAAPAKPSAAAAAPADGQALFVNKCGYCHLPMGPGTVTLQRRMSPEQALLANRTDLTADYVKMVARHGLNSMPPINRIEVSDSELDTIARWLAKGPKGRPAAK
ncbi:MAG TPA: cytochrome c [Sphingomonadaceae bacterium]|nr:cytochrome c [Sphingomonadaceae bacterium]